MKSNLDKLSDYINDMPSREQLAWDIIHDSTNVMLHFIDKNQVSVPQSFHDDLERLSPNSTIQDLANLFYKIGYVPEWFYIK